MMRARRPAMNAGARVPNAPAPVPDQACEFEASSLMKSIDPKRR
jgi:hypothetical protein